MRHKSFIILCILFSLKTNAQGISESDFVINKIGVESKIENTLNFHPTFDCSLEEVKQKVKSKANGVAVFCAYHSIDFSPGLKLQKNENNILLTREVQNEVGIDEMTYKLKRNFFSFNKSFANQNKEFELSLIPAFDENNRERKFAEIIVFDKFLSKKEIKKMESYFSMKYGISLPLNKDYFNGDGDVIYKRKSNSEFGNRLTCIGRDDKTNLFQKQSCNVDDEFGLSLSIGAFKNLNLQNSSSIEDNTYLFWSDNNKPYDFQFENHMAICEKIWKLELNNDFRFNDNLHLRIDNNLLIEKGLNNMELYLVLDKKANKNIDFNDAVKVKLNQNNQFLEAIVKKELIQEIDELVFSFIAVKGNKTIETDDLLVYPNPILSGQSFTIELPESEYQESETYDLEIIDAKGALISKLVINNQIEQKLSAPGFYTIVIKNEHREFIKKIIVQ